MIYIAQPYSGSTELMHIRYQLAKAYCAYMMLDGEVGIYSPIVHCHNIAMVYDLPTDAEFWRKENFYMLSLTTKMHVLQLDGHKKSPGLNAEINYCNENGINMVHVPERFIETIPGGKLWLQRHNAQLTV